MSSTRKIEDYALLGDLQTAVLVHHWVDRLVLFPTIRLRRLLRRPPGRTGAWSLAPGAGDGDAPKRPPLSPPDPDSGDDPRDGGGERPHHRLHAAAGKGSRYRPDY